MPSNEPLPAGAGGDFPRSRSVVDLTRANPLEDEATAPVRPALLLVDDDPRNITALSGLLAGLDADLVSATSGLEALRLVLQRDFCAILMDVRMPGMDGYETVAIIRQREKSRRIPVIFLTAYDKDDMHVVRGYSAGAVDYVFKPVEPVILRAKVSVFIELHKQADEIRRKAEHERQLLEENLRIRAEHVEAEHQLRSTEKREATVIRSLPIAVYEAELSSEGAVRTFLHDESVKRLLGFHAAVFAEDTELWATRIHGEDIDNVLNALKNIPSGGDYSVEYRWRCADDVFRYFLDRGVVATGGNGSESRIFGTMFDVHDRRMLEQQLLHAQKIDAVGKLTGGIAHDFNNMLTVVIGNLDRMQRTENLDARTARRIDHALQGALHCRDMTKRLLGFSRQQSQAPQAINLNELIHSLADLLSRTLGERVDIRTELAEDLAAVYIDPGQIEAAILNLLVNARDAMPKGGRVVIRTAEARVDNSWRGKDPDLAAGRYVLLQVADSGIGMSEEVRSKACDAFFTTKEEGNGTGLGLSTIHGFVKQSGGGLGIESAPGAGTTISIYLPSYAGAAHRPSVTSGDKGHAKLPRAREGDVILLVEDEAAVRQTAVSALTELGYRIIEADTAASALQALGAAEDVRLLFTDIIMPGSENGYELALEAQRRRPELKVLFTSGYGGEIVASAGEDALKPFLLKPYRDYELACAVRDALD